MPKRPPRRCGTCKHLSVPPDADGKVRVRPTRAYRCRYQVPWPPLPDSITKAHDFRLPRSEDRGSWSDNGTTCPTWEPRG